MLTIKPIQSSISNLRQKRIDSAKSQISEKLRENKEEFYKQYQEYTSIYDREQASQVVNEFMQSKPSGYDDKKYLQQLLKIKKSDLSQPQICKILPPENPEHKALYQGYSEPDYYCQIKQKYFSQKAFTDSDANDETEIDFRKLKLDKNLSQSVFARNAFKKEDILNILEQSKDLTLNSGSLLKEYYDKDTIFDLPLRFATACYNSRDLGNGYIQDKVPEIFKDIPTEELLCSLDKFSTRFRTTDMETGNPDEYINVKIAGKTFYFKPLLSGEECRTFIISQNKGEDKNSVIYKLYYDDNRDRHFNRASSPSGIIFAPAGLYGNIGILREANRAGVSNVPELYMSNPIFYPVESKGEKYMGGWAVVENANNKKVQDGLDFEQWLNGMGLMLNDKKDSTMVNDVYVDLGFIANSNREFDYGTGWGNELVNQVYSRYLNYESTQDIIDYLSKTKVIYKGGINNLF